MKALCFRENPTHASDLANVPLGQVTHKAAVIQNFARAHSFKIIWAPRGLIFYFKNKYPVYNNSDIILHNISSTGHTLSPTIHSPQYVTHNMLPTICYPQYIQYVTHNTSSTIYILSPTIYSSQHVCICYE